MICPDRINYIQKPPLTLHTQSTRPQEILMIIVESESPRNHGSDFGVVGGGGGGND